jgi:predicted nucleotidyltransferase
MRSDLQYVLDILRAHEAELRRLGVTHAAVFGSVARGEAGAESDVDVLVDLDENRPMGIFEYARTKLYINEILEGPSDVVNRRTLKPLQVFCTTRFRPSKNPAQRLADIIDNVDAIQEFTADLDFPAFRADRKAVYAVVRALEIIPEAPRGAFPMI